MYFEQLRPGQVIETGTHVITAEEMAAFAAAYDPQPIHTDPDGGPHGEFGRPVASGFQTMAIAWRLWVEIVMQTHGRAGIGLTDTRFLAPVFAGTRLRARVRLDEHRLTTRGLGLITMAFEVFGDDEPVLTFRTTGLLDRAPDSASAAAPQAIEVTAPHG